jgi:hypothetical protein
MTFFDFLERFLCRLRTRQDPLAPLVTARRSPTSPTRERSPTSRASASYRGLPPSHHPSRCKILCHSGWQLPAWTSHSICSCAVAGEASAASGGEGRRPGSSLRGRRILPRPPFLAYHPCRYRNRSILHLGVPSVAFRCPRQQLAHRVLCTSRGAASGASGGEAAGRRRRKRRRSRPRG